MERGGEGREELLRLLRWEECLYKSCVLEIMGIALCYVFLEADGEGTNFHRCLAM